MTLSIVLIYPELLGTYGDRGNALVLAHRAQLRDIKSKIICVSPGEQIPTSGDIYFCGGGEDNAQKLAVDLLQDQLHNLNYIIANSLLVAICAGFQILGKQFPLSNGNLYKGLSILDITTYSGDSRAIGEILIDPNNEDIGLLSGFENHQGRTLLGQSVKPLGKVISGYGNGIVSTHGFEDGIFSEHIIGTYLHGPICARNPSLADYLIAKACGIRFASLERLDNDPAVILHRERLNAVRNDRVSN